jgi:glycosyltransferase involved in cell wall biosynthesis
LIRAMLAAGHRVTAVSDEFHPSMSETLGLWGADFHAVPFARTGMNPVADAATVHALTQLMRSVRPDTYFGYTIKPSTYGMLAARLAGVRRRAAMITGVGYALSDGRGMRRRVARSGVEILCRGTLRLADRIVFQNPDDQALFVRRHLVRADKTARVNGSGVDLDHFSMTPQARGPLTFLLLTRLLRDKGIVEYVEAARQIKRRHPDVRFLLVGPLDPNPSSIKRVELDAWTAEGVIEWPGAVSDVRPIIAASNVAVLPSSYGEGTPRAILEAMAMGRAVVTTDAPGCRETVVDGENGLLVAPRDPNSLAQAMMRFVVDPTLAVGMGAASRRLAERRFDVNAVNVRMLSIIGLAEQRRRARPERSAARWVGVFE